jgi:hypothetical protein
VGDAIVANLLKNEIMAKDTQQAREEILQSALNARVQEVMHYQINIDNYTLALEQISAKSHDERAELAGFAEQLRALLASEKLEQKKSKIMLAVLKQQLE